MSDYKIHVKNETESRQAQKYFFALGCLWSGNSAEFRHTHMPYLYMIHQQNTKQLTDDQKSQQNVQTWHEPALHTLEKLLEIRRANLRKINRDEANAAVTRDELIEALSQRHRISYYDAGMIISSLHRADKIIMFGRFIQVKDQGGEV